MTQDLKVNSKEHFVKMKDGKEIPLDNVSLERAEEAQLVQIDAFLRLLWDIRRISPVDIDSADLHVETKSFLKRELVHLRLSRLGPSAFERPLEHAKIVCCLYIMRFVSLFKPS